MEMLIRLGSFLSPSFFAVLAGLSLTAAALLFVAGKRNTAEAQVRGTKLSQLEPLEYRSTGYLLLAFGSSIAGLVLGFIFGAIGASPWGRLILVILLLLCLLLTLCFLYAGGGTLLRAVTGQKGGALNWFFPAQPLDTLLRWLGDLFTIGLFRKPWYLSIFAKVGLAKEIPTAITSGYEEAKASEEMEILLRRKLAAYEARLTPKQREKLMEGRRIIEELSSMYP